MTRQAVSIILGERSLRATVMTIKPTKLLLRCFDLARYAPNPGEGEGYVTCDLRPWRKDEAADVGFCSSRAVVMQ